MKKLKPAMQKWIVNYEVLDDEGDLLRTEERHFSTGDIAAIRKVLEANGTNKIGSIWTATEE